MALERCHVETWAEFGSIGTSCSPKLMVGSKTDVFLCTGCDEIYVFSTKERKLTAVLQFPSPVNDLVQSYDKYLYVACMCGVYCVDLQLLPSSGQCADASICPVELKISSKFLVVPEKGVLSLLLVGSELVIISLKPPHWKLTLYRSQTVTNSFEMLTSFNLASSSDNNEERTVKRRPVLICVHYSNSSLSSVCSSPPETANGGHVCIDPVLFKRLFGIDTALVESPVVLCGLPDGCLYFLPLRLPGSRPRVLYSLEQPVMFVGTSLDKSGPEHAQCLVAIGEHGRVVLVRTGQGQLEEGDNAACFLERLLPGSLVCGCIVKNTLYYSVGSDLLKVDLQSGSLGKEGQNRKEEVSRQTALHLSPTSLNVCRIITLDELKSNNAGGDVHLLGLSVGGQLKRITVCRRTGDADSSKGPTVQVGRSVRDLLSAIGDVCERASVLKTVIKSKSQVLKHLNQVVNISFLLTACAKAEDHFHRKPIRCRAVAEWSRLLQRDSLKLTCVLDNSSPYSLEQGWILSICVSSLSYPPSEGGKCPSTTYSFPFQNVNPRETFEVSLPLAAAGEAFFPFMVSCSLIFSLSSLLGAEEATCLSLPYSCINLPLNTLWVDWLHSLRLRDPEDARKTDTAQCNNNTAMDSIQAFMNSHQFRGRGSAEGRGDALKPELYSANVQVSSELLKNAKGLKPSDLEGQGQNLCVSFLDWLLSEGCGGVRRGHTGDKISAPVLHARGPNGREVKLTAKEVIVGEECTGRQGSMTTVVLQMESSFMAAVCGLHHAVLRRLETLLQQTPEKASSPESVRRLRLRQAMLRVEHLSQQIQNSRVSGAFSVGVSGTQITQCLRSIYRDLRENPLIIM